MRISTLFLCLDCTAAAFSSANRLSFSRIAAQRSESPKMIDMDLKGKVAFVAGVGDSTGYGWAICKALAEVRYQPAPLPMVDCPVLLLL